MPADRLNKQERAVSDKISTLEDMIAKAAVAQNVLAGLSLDSQLYYDDSGQPSRLVELGRGGRTSVRAALQRNLRSPWWTLEWVVYVDGANKWEKAVETNRFADLAEAAEKIVSDYLYFNSP